MIFGFLRNLLIYLKVLYYMNHIFFAQVDLLIKLKYKM